MPQIKPFPDEVLKKLKPILEDPSIKKVGQNIKYDFIIFKNHGIELSPIDDTMLLSYTLDAGNNRHNMDTLSELHLGQVPTSCQIILTRFICVHDVS